MTAEQTLTQIKVFCIQDSGDEQIWTSNNTTYHWNRGRDTASGMINGVVRKLESIEVSGRKIWVVAGSFKISATGQILRFTGLPKRLQKSFITGPVHYTNTNNPIDFPQTA